MFHEREVPGLGCITVYFNSCCGLKKKEKIFPEKNRNLLQNFQSNFLLKFKIRFSFIDISDENLLAENQKWTCHLSLVSRPISLSMWNYWNQNHRNVSHEVSATFIKWIIDGVDVFLSTSIESRLDILKCKFDKINSYCATLSYLKSEENHGKKKMPKEKRKLVADSNLNSFSSFQRIKYSCSVNVLNVI